MPPLVPLHERHRERPAARGVVVEHLGLRPDVVDAGDHQHVLALGHVADAEHRAELPEVMGQRDGGVLVVGRLYPLQVFGLGQRLDFAVGNPLVRHPDVLEPLARAGFIVGTDHADGGIPAGHVARLRDQWNGGVDVGHRGNPLVVCLGPRLPQAPVSFQFFSCFSGFSGRRSGFRSASVQTPIFGPRQSIGSGL